MCALKLSLGFILLYFMTGFGFAQDLSWYWVDKDKTVHLRVKAFLSSTCPHCQKAEPFLDDVKRMYPWLDIERYEVDKDKAGLEKFYQLLQQQKSGDFSVPAFFFCNTHWLGFADEKTTGMQLIKNLEYCRDEIAKSGTLTPMTEQILAQQAVAGWYQASMIEKSQALVFVPAMALFDLLLPCTFFSIFALIGLLFLVDSKVKQVGACIFFILGIGIAQHVGLEHPNFLYRLYQEPWIRIVPIVVGLGLLVYVFSFYVTGVLAKKPASIYSYLLLVFLTAILLQFYEQNQEPNFTLIFHNWLEAQEGSALFKDACSFFYQFVYLLSLFLVAFSLKSIVYFYGKRVDKLSRVLEYSRHYLIIISLIFIFRPYLLANAKVLFLVVLLSFFSTWIYFLKLKKQH